MSYGRSNYLSVFKFLKLIILKAAVEREKAVQAIDGHRECINCAATFWVMSQFLHFLGAARGCADFRDPTTVFRFKQAWAELEQSAMQARSTPAVMLPQIYPI